MYGSGLISSSVHLLEDEEANQERLVVVVVEDLFLVGNEEDTLVDRW